MVARSIGIVICRVGAVLLFMQGLQNIGYVIYPIDDFFGSWSGFLAGAVLLAGAPVAAGIALWFFADRICDFDQKPYADSASQTIASADLISAGTYLIGVYVLVFALVSMVNVELSFLAAPALDSGASESSQRMDGQAITRRVNYVLRIVVGFVLMRIGRQAQNRQQQREPD